VKTELRTAVALLAENGRRRSFEKLTGTSLFDSNRPLRNHRGSVSEVGNEEETEKRGAVGIRRPQRERTAMSTKRY